MRTMISSYEETLTQFAEGKRLGRLTRAVGGQSDASCDACGSTLPRTLFGLKDGATGRCFFVGQNCLAWLMESGLVARARYRQSAVIAYRLEMELRRNGLNGDPEVPSDEAAQLDEPAPSARFSPFRRTVLVVVSSNECRALARLSDGQRSVSSRASEPRWRLEWSRLDGGLVLQRVWRPRRALTASALKAYRRARALWRMGADPRSG